MDQYNTKDTLSRICQPNNQNNLSCKKWWSEQKLNYLYQQAKQILKENCMS